MERINEVTKGCFNALVQLRATDPASAINPELPYQHLRGCIDQLLIDAREAGYDEVDVVDITYAIVGLADEIALHQGGAIRELWMQRPLQLHYFNENLAGEGFYRRLDAVMRDPSRAEILRVFYTCLLFGFEGKFAIRGGELELDAILNRVKHALHHELVDQPLSVQPLRPTDEPSGARRFPAVWVALFCLLFSLGLLIALRIGLDGQTAQIVERMAPLAQPTDTQAMDAQR